MADVEQMLQDIDVIHGRIVELRDDRDRLQAAIDRAHAALLSSQYVGGLTEREAYRTAYDALCEVATQHQGVEA